MIRNFPTEPLIVIGFAVLVAMTISALQFAPSGAGKAAWEVTQQGGHYYTNTKPEFYPNSGAVRVETDNGTVILHPGSGAIRVKANAMAEAKGGTK